MKPFRKTVFGAALLAGLMLAGLQHGHACPACYGDPQSSMTDGLNMAVVSLLGVT